jgi:hypothetical protein
VAIALDTLQSAQAGGSRGTVNDRVPATIAAALIQLAQAEPLVTAAGHNLWDFAIEIGNLRLGPNELRWLIYHGFVEHGWEITPIGAKNRSFRRNMGVTLGPRSCFVATPAGLSLASACFTAIEKKPIQSTPAANGNGHAVMLKGPQWNSAAREFHVDGVLVKRFRQRAVNQERILSAFQEEGWPPLIDDPLPPDAGQDSKSRLHYAIRNLNRCQKIRLIHFEGDGTGERVAWKQVHSRSIRRSRHDSSATLELS